LNVVYFKQNISVSYYFTVTLILNYN